MPQTRPNSEQLRLLSSRTGSHILDTYLEAAEHGDRSLADLLADLFDETTGEFRADIFEFRIKPTTNEFQFRVGDWPDSSSGWQDTGDYLFRQRGAFSNGTAYKRFDFVTYNNDVYICTTDHTSSTSSPGANFNTVVAYTGAALLARLLTVDGPSSGLDADQLDGEHGAFYQNADNLNDGTLPAARFNDTAHGARAGGSLHAEATTGAAGFLSSSDKTKLNALDPSSIAAALDARVRVDADQGLTATQQGRARANIGISPAEDDRIINGAFEIAQRGASTSIDGYGGPDRWVNGLSGGTVTHEQIALTIGDTLGSNTVRYASRQAVSAQAAASDYAARIQRIEGVHSYAGQPVTLLGWARRVAGAGNMAVEGVQVFGTGGSPSSPVTGIGASSVALSTLWSPFAVTMTIPSIAGKTLGSNGDDCFAPHFWASAGSDWNARTNSLGIQTITVDLWGVHIRKGVVPVEAAAFYTPPPASRTLRECKRYFYSHHAIGLVSMPERVYASAAGGAGFGALHPVDMRTSPTGAIAWAVNDVPQGSNPTVFGANQFGWTAAATGLAAGAAIDVLSYTMDAEL